MAQQFLAAIVSQLRVKARMSDEPFSLDGTLVQAWARQKSFRPRADPSAASDKDDRSTSPPAAQRKAEPDWRGQKRSNQTHANKTDPVARLAQAARPPPPGRRKAGGR